MKRMLQTLAGLLVIVITFTISQLSIVEAGGGGGDPLALSPAEVQGWCAQYGCQLNQLTQAVESNGVINPHAVKYDGNLGNPPRHSAFDVPSGIGGEATDCFSDVPITPGHMTQVCAATFRREAPLSNPTATPTATSVATATPTPTTTTSPQCTAEFNTKPYFQSPSQFVRVGGVAGNWSSVSNEPHAGHFNSGSVDTCLRVPPGFEIQTQSGTEKTANATLITRVATVRPQQGTITQAERECRTVSTQRVSPPQVGKKRVVTAAFLAKYLGGAETDYTRFSTRAGDSGWIFKAPQNELTCLTVNNTKPRFSIETENGTLTRVGQHANVFAATVR